MAAAFVERGLSLPLLVVLLGPTGSGKTSLAIALAEHFSGEIVSCDSIAVYCDLEIGAAKPSHEERQRIPHHLIDVVSPADFLTAGDYSRLARQALNEIIARQHLPIVAGGTGLYLRALLEGLFAGPPRSEELRQRLREIAQERGAPYLHKLLQRFDPSAALVIHPNDAAKMIRALEICIRSRRRMTDLWQQGRDSLQGFRILRLGLNPERELLYQRLNARAQQMFQQGLIEETRSLVQHYGDSIQPLQSLGYKQAVQYLRGELSLEQAILLVQQGHRNYAKRQMTWLRREPDVHWLNGFGDHPHVQQTCMEHLHRQL